MIAPTRLRERRLQRNGWRFIAGADEAGRGAWAGPLVAAAVILPKNFSARGIRDSKLLTPPAREIAYERIVQEAVAWNVCIVTPSSIDQGGVHRANLQALMKAVKGLRVTADYALIDAWQLTLPMPSQGIIGGDRTVLSIAAASIIAKVTRDRLLVELSQKFPDYNLSQHKGYGTRAHRSALTRFGPSPIHRFSFAPIARLTSITSLTSYGTHSLR